MTEKQHRGFACMTPEKRAEIASKGGSAVPPDKRYYSTHHEQAVEAGRRGGAAGKGKRK